MDTEEEIKELKTRILQLEEKVDRLTTAVTLKRAPISPIVSIGKALSVIFGAILIIYICAYIYHLVVN